MLKTGGLERPSKLAIHGFLTVNGKKSVEAGTGRLSRRRRLRASGSAVSAVFLRDETGAGRAEDLDLSFEDFKARWMGNW